MIYLDNAATSFPKAPGVAEAVAASIASLPGSTGRASHPLAVEASRRLFAARNALAGFLGMADSSRLVFTKNATEALNLAILGSVPDGGRVLCSSLEHNAVMRPLRHLEESHGVRVDVFRVGADGLVEEEGLLAGLSRSPDLLVVTGASNVTGAVLPVAHIASMARCQGVAVLVDGSQLAGHAPVDLASMGADMFAFAGHKGLMGAAGTGGLCVATEREIAPLLRGGTGSASTEERQPRFLPDALEAGTPNLAAIEGLAAAVAWIQSIGLAEKSIREQAMVMRLAEGLGRLPGMEIVGGRAAGRVPVLSITSSLLPERELAMALDRLGVAARVGLHCSPAAHRSIGTMARGGTLRFSPGYFTSEDEVDSVVRVLEEALP